MLSAIMPLQINIPENDEERVCYDKPQALLTACLKISIIFNQRSAARACGFVLRQALISLSKFYLLLNM